MWLYVQAHYSMTKKLRHDDGYEHGIKVYGYEPNTKICGCRYKHKTKGCFVKFEGGFITIYSAVGFP